MLMTVREVLALPSYEGARLLAGSKGLDNRVIRVDVIEVPDAVEWMRGGEFLITAGYAFKDQPHRLAGLVRGLAAKGSAGLAIKVQRFIKALPGEVIEAAEEVGFPLIDLPPEIPFVELTTPVLTQILAEQTFLLERATQVHKKLARVVVDGEGLTGVAKGLAEALNNPVVIENERFLPLAWHVPATAAPFLDQSELEANLTARVWGEIEQAGLAAQLHTRLDTVEWKGRQEQGQVVRLPRLIAPVVIDRKVRGYVTLLQVSRTPQGTAELYLEQAAIVTALEISKQEAIAEAKTRIQEDLVQDLLMGHFDSPDLMVRRAAYFEWDLQRPLVVIALDVDCFERYYLGFSRTEDEIQRLKERLLQSTREVAVGLDPRAIVSSRSDSIVVLTSVAGRGPSEKEAAVATAEAIKSYLGEQVGEVKVTVGIGSQSRSPADIPKSYRQARQALRIGKLLSGGDRVFHYSDLGLYRLLLEVAERPGLQEFFRETVGSLVDYDREHGTTLCETLERFLELSGNRKESARQLYIHRNTLNYRLRRIEELLGVDLGDPEARLKLLVALRARHFVGYNKAPA
ncbi:MAG: PucR family transcriptional regulator ligand-binding domain-containing protein [Bacillota bacterium]|nr:PucR family transcriptional regulator ligand-binding domain-containing protein [Bacillota bacterium]